MADFPDVCPSSVGGWGIIANTQSYISPLTNTTQTSALFGDYWQGSLSYTNKVGTDARQLKAFIFSLRGVSDSFNFPPPDLDQQGTAAGTGVVSGSNQTGTELVTTGWDPSQPLLLAAGDYFTINDELKMVTADTSSDAGGNATIPFAPPLRQSPANGQQLEVDFPYAVMRLSDNSQAQFQVNSPIIYNLTINILEDF